MQRLKITTTSIKSTRAKQAREAIYTYLEQNLSKYGLVTKEYRFHPVRQWQADWALLRLHNGDGCNILVEFEGGVFTQGGHTRGVGYSQNCEKYNQAAILGYKVLRYTVKTYTDITKDLKQIFEMEEL